MRPKGRFTDGLKAMIDYLPMNNIVMAELGSYAGESTQIFLNSSKIKRIDAFDLWDDHDAEIVFDELWYNHLTISDVHRLYKYKHNILMTYRDIEDDCYDFIYIDADHTYESTKANIINWYPKLKATGIMGGHDYSHKYWPGVVKAVNELFHNRNIIFFPDSSWIVGKYNELC